MERVQALRLIKIDIRELSLLIKTLLISQNSDLTQILFTGGTRPSFTPNTQTRVRRAETLPSDFGPLPRGHRRGREEGVRPALSDLSRVSLRVERIEQPGKGLA